MGDADDDLDQFEPEAVVHALESRLRTSATPDRAEQEKRYLKSELEHIGVTVPQVRSEVKKLLKAQVPKRRVETLELAKALWDRPVHELRLAATLVLAERQALLEGADLPLLERFLRDSRTWALIDGLAPSVAGPLAFRAPNGREMLVRWSRDPDFWLRRSAVLAYLLPMRRGEPVFYAFAALADPLLEDREFFVRKALGWVLRERTKSNPDEVVSWLESRKCRASRLTLREASKNLPEAQRRVLLGR